MNEEREKETEGEAASERERKEEEGRERKREGMRERKKGKMKDGETILPPRYPRQSSCSDLREENHCGKTQDFNTRTFVCGYSLQVLVLMLYVKGNVQWCLFVVARRTPMALLI